MLRNWAYKLPLSRLSSAIFGEDKGHLHSLATPIKCGQQSLYWYRNGGLESLNDFKLRNGHYFATLHGDLSIGLNSCALVNEEICLYFI